MSDAPHSNSRCGSHLVLGASTASGLVFVMKRWDVQAHLTPSDLKCLNSLA